MMDNMLRYRQNGQKGSRNMIIRVEYFDGVYQKTRICIYLGTDKYLVKDRYEDGTEYVVMDHGRPYHSYSAALKLMEEVME